MSLDIALRLNKPRIRKKRGRRISIGKSKKIIINNRETMELISSIASNLLRLLVART